MINWNEFAGNNEGIDFSRFNKDQQYEIRRGIDLELPVQFYANPCLSAQEMANIRNALETAVCARYEPEEHFVITDYGPEELSPGFRSESNFAKHPERICYVPENWDFDEGFGYTGSDFLKLCNGDAQKAQQLFNECEWQHPETVLDEWERDKDLAPDFFSVEPIVTVQTKFGDLVASVKSDADYPGISIELKGSNVNAQYQDHAVCLAWVEFSPEKDNIQAVVYGDGNAEEFTHLVEYENILSLGKDKPSLGEQISSAEAKVPQQQVVAQSHTLDR